MSYVGQDVGNTQMWYLLGMAGSDSNVKAALDKVDTFLSLSVCPYYGNGGLADADKAGEIKLSDDQFNRLNNAGTYFFFGEGSSANSLNEYCSREVDSLECKDMLKPFEDYLSSTSTLNSYTLQREAIDAKVYKANPTPGSTGEAIDLGSAAGPSIFFFTGEDDMICPTEIADGLVESGVSVKKHYNYGCGSGHEIFYSRGPTQARLIKDMVIALGAETLLAGFVGVLTTSLLALF